MTYINWALTHFTQKSISRASLCKLCTVIISGHEAFHATMHGSLAQSHNNHAPLTAAFMCYPLWALVSMLMRRRRTLKRWLKFHENTMAACVCVCVCVRTRLHVSVFSCGCMCVFLWYGSCGRKGERNKRPMQHMWLLCPGEAGCMHSLYGCVGGPLVTGAGRTTAHMSANVPALSAVDGSPHSPVLSYLLGLLCHLRSGPR